MSAVATGLSGVRQEFVTVIRQSRCEQNRDLENVYKEFTKCLQNLEVGMTTSQVQTAQSNSPRGLPLVDEGNWTEGTFRMSC
jgi:hypothetical protein